MTIVHLTKPVTMLVVNSMMEWLRNIDMKYEFTGEGIELIKFYDSEDAVAFKLRFEL